MSLHRTQYLARAIVVAAFVLIGREQTLISVELEVVLER